MHIPIILPVSFRKFQKCFLGNVGEELIYLLYAFPVAQPTAPKYCRKTVFQRYHGIFFYKHLPSLKKTVSRFFE